MRCEYITGSRIAVSTLNLKESQRFSLVTEKNPHKHHKPFAKVPVLCYTIVLYGYDSDP
jgi:hypothetical protein